MKFKFTLLFYVHNLGNYDIGFILKVLTTANTIYNIYNINVISRDSLLLSLSIGIKYKGRSLSIKIVDSYNI